MVAARLRYGAEIERLKNSGQSGMDVACLQALQAWHDAVQALRDFEHTRSGGSGQPEEGRTYSYDSLETRERAKSAKKRYREAMDAQSVNPRAPLSQDAWVALQDWHEAVRDLCTFQKTSLDGMSYRKSPSPPTEGVEDIATESRYSLLGTSGLKLEKERQSAPVSPPTFR
jgi:hypothetical protein